MNEFGQADFIATFVATDSGPMAALIVRAIDQQVANARGAHLSEGDPLRALRSVVAAAGLGRHESASLQAATLSCGFIS